MSTIIDLENKQGVWFEMDGGGRVQLRTINGDDFKAIKKQTTKKKVDFKRVEGKAERFEYEEVNEDLQNELFWDHIIVDWENFFDGKENSIPCNRDNKIMLMSRSMKFSTFVVDSLKTLTDSEIAQAEKTETNL